MKKIGILFGKDFLIDSEDPEIVKLAIKWFEDLEKREKEVFNKEIELRIIRFKLNI